MVSHIDSFETEAKGKWTITVVTLFRGGRLVPKFEGGHVQILLILPYVKNIFCCPLPLLMLVPYNVMVGGHARIRTRDLQFANQDLIYYHLCLEVVLTCGSEVLEISSFGNIVITILYLLLLEEPL